MNTPCTHHKTCGDCFGAETVTDREKQLQSLATRYAEATEWNLATIDEMLCRKRTPKSSLSRQRDICLKMLQTCAQITQSVVWDEGLWDRRLTKFGRTKEILEAPEGIEKGLDALIQRCKGSP